MDALSRPLSPPELDTLEDFLASPQFEYRAMELPMLEGFLTALVIGPRMVMPGEWLPRVWDRYDAAVAPDFADAGQAARITSLLMRFMNGIADTFLNDPGAFQPSSGSPSGEAPRNGVKASWPAPRSAKPNGPRSGTRSPHWPHP